MAGNLILRASAWTQMLSTELNNLASTYGALQATGTNAAFDNTNSATRFSRMRIELDVTFASAPNAGTTVDFYIVPLGQDGSNYWDGAGGATPVAPYSQLVGKVAVRAINTVQRVGLRNIPIGYEQFILLLVNSTNVAFPATGSTVKILCEAGAYT